MLIKSKNTIEEFEQSLVWMQIKADIQRDIERGRDFLELGIDEQGAELTERKSWEIRGSLQRMKEFLQLPEIYKEELTKPDEEVKDA